MSAQPQTELSPQISPDLRRTTTYLTGHNEEGKAKVHSARPAAWKAFDEGTMGFNQIYTNSFPSNLNDDADVKFHEQIISSGNLGLATRNGVVCRMVDFGPQYECMMHRTKSLDFGIIVEGEVEMKLDDGSTTLMKRGDVAVQRATMHAWRNPSTTNWARMVFVLQDTKPLFVNGEKFGEDYGRGTEGLPPSGNDEE
ncbi:uncharacterized protein GGS22DRAFT_198213 [Annulohypoxylon maeteangense]|uniref:uncharacterized protein n=1 Tax=Annulohypoxylon maeteangense TaxID=1927788 RepID=UPI00200858DD|nr:uncharacterized protein GGS22DRAFT_198213 [Annulohypoxylon maeteangense]KAI0888497.1 hypothetical protein GGS22DRAFT_198213 [Annulohypoxylon maeteangense]